jgi:hypothetical protein
LEISARINGRGLDHGNRFSPAATSRRAASNATDHPFLVDRLADAPEVRDKGMMGITLRYPFEVRGSTWPFTTKTALKDLIPKKPKGGEERAAQRASAIKRHQLDGCVAPERCAELSTEVRPEERPQAHRGSEGNAAADSGQEPQGSC